MPLDPLSHQKRAQARRSKNRLIELSRQPDAPPRAAGSGRPSVSLGGSFGASTGSRLDEDGATKSEMNWDDDNWDASYWA